MSLLWVMGMSRVFGFGMDGWIDIHICIHPCTCQCRNRLAFSREPPPPKTPPPFSPTPQTKRPTVAALWPPSPATDAGVAAAPPAGARYLDFFDATLPLSGLKAAAAGGCGCV